MQPACARCGSKRVWAERGGFLFECADCDHQMSLTSGTLLEKTRKPFKVWFRAVFRSPPGQRHLGQGAAADLGARLLQDGVELAAQAQSGAGACRSEPLGPFVQIDEALVGGKGSPHKELVLVAAETDGRVRLAHAENNDECTLKSFADSQIALDTQVVTDGLASYNSESLGQRPHQAVSQTKQERHESDALQGCHWTVSLLKRWLLGMHAGAVKPKHLQAYLDEFAFRFNRRKTNGVGRIAARTIEQLVARPPLTRKMLIRETVPCRVSGANGTR